jgi:hypothetical protein
VGRYLALVEIFWASAPIAATIAAPPMVGSPLIISLAALSEKKEATFQPDLEHRAAI